MANLICIWYIDGFFLMIGNILEIVCIKDNEIKIDSKMYNKVFKSNEISIAFTSPRTSNYWN